MIVRVGLMPGMRRGLGLLLALASLAGTGVGRSEESRGEAPKPEPRESRRVVVGVSPFLPEEAKDGVYRALVRLLLEELPLESSLAVYDAYHLRTIAQARVPGVRAFTSSKTRANQFRGPIQELRQFLASSDASSGNGRDGTNPPVVAALRVPQFMDFVAANLLHGSTSTVVVLLGSPLYRDEKEPAFSMLGGFFPSDGHLRATRERSVFGVADRRDRLKSVAVDWGFFGDPWVTELHQEKVARFWSLFLQEQGARLGAFSGDLPTVFQAVREAAESGGSRAVPSAFVIDPKQTKIEMIRIAREVRTAEWITGDLPSGPRPEPPVAARGPVKIGIRWKGDLDLDLYARSRPDSTTLCFESPRNAEGYYFKDHRSSPEREYEFVEFQEPVDLREVEAAVNFYAGHRKGGVEGEVRVEFENRIYAGQFKLPASGGNEGRAGVGQEKCWATIDVLNLVGLREKVARASNDPGVK